MQRFHAPSRLMHPIGYIQEVPWSPVDLEACRQRMSADESAKDALFWDDELPRPLAAHVGPGEVVIHLILHALFYVGCCGCPLDLALWLMVLPPT